MTEVSRTADARRRARHKAWETRRAKYGPSGRSPGAYARGCHCESMRAVLIDLHRSGVLSEGQVARVTGLDRVEVRRRVDLANEDGA